MSSLSIPEDKFATRVTTKKPSARRRGAVTFLSGGDQLVKNIFFKFFEVIVLLCTLRLHRPLQLSTPMLHGQRSTTIWKIRQGL
jgi:hypothetical protein